MANIEDIKIHTMHDDLAAANRKHPPVHRQEVRKPPVKPKVKSSPSRPNYGNLTLPQRLVPRSLGKGGSIWRGQIIWFAIAAAVLIILNAIIWSIAIIS